ncbi:MAG: class I tRNA ligase family protein, partial [Rhodobacteraceae bacterium]|nr:class I tRNA ligase family protein [Paracoccaceae bacterium]
VMVIETQTDDDGNEVETAVPLVESKPIMQPFGDRSKVVIEPMLTDQWFVDAAKVVGPALDAVKDGTVKILPESGEKTYYHWLENIEPWCISRQLWWGHQIPVWYGPRNQSEILADVQRGLDLKQASSELKAFCAPSQEEVRTLAQDYYGDDAPVIFEGEPEPELQGKTRDDGKFEVRVAWRELRRDPDVLDTWFSSGLWPIGTLGWPEDTEEMQKYFPTDVLITGFDILFFWVARMMMMQLAVADNIPFHTVYLHQLVRDEKGKKMSKTTGNVIDPLEIVDEFGADALRFTNAAMASIGGVLKLSKDRITGYRNFGTKLWNACRFAEMNEVFTHRDAAFDPSTPSQTVNRWIIGETAKVRAEVDAVLEAYRFNDAASALYGFVWGKVCDWYLEFSKPLFASDDAEVIAETRATMAWVLDQCLILLHPVMPFITEELWGELAERQGMLVHQEWPAYGAELVDAASDTEMNWVISLIEGIRSTRAQSHVPAGLKVPLVVADWDAAAQNAWTTNETMIKRLARVETLNVVDSFPKGCATVPVMGASFGLPLADIIDVDEEKARLEKTLGKLAKELGGLRGRLNNPKFVASAPEDVVDEAKANLAAREEEEAQIKAAIARLAELG